MGTTANPGEPPSTPVDYALWEHEVFVKEHDPEAYASGLLRPRKGYCFPCGAWVPRTGCAPYLEHSSAVRREQERQRQVRIAGGHQQ